MTITQKRRQIWFCKSAAAVLLMLASLPHRAAAQVPFIVQWQQERLSVSADGAVLATVIQEVARRTGLEVRDSASLQNKVRIHFSGLPLRQAVTKLLGDTSYALIDCPTGARAPTKHVLVILGEPSHAIARRPEFDRKPVVAVKTVNGENAVQEADQLRHAAKSGDTTALRRAATDGDPVAQGLALQLLASTDPEQAAKVAAIAAQSSDLSRKLSGIQVFSGVDAPEAQNTLGAALKDPDLSVRQAAVMGLVSQTGPGTADLLIEATRDQDPSIRMQALEFLSQRGAEGEAGLTSALTSSDLAVRSRARELLDQMN